MDEGYLENNGTLKGGVSYMDTNDDLEKNMGIKDFFEGDDSVEAWIVNTMDNLREFVNKY